jgi:hypothetical protein
MIFGLSQICVDIQPLVVTLANTGGLHGFSHTFLGAWQLQLAARRITAQ